MANNSMREVVLESINSAFGKVALAKLIRNDLAPLSVMLVNEHVAQGRFMDGDYKDKGYSETTLPAFFLGDLEKSGDEWRIKNVELNKTISPGDDLVWRWNQDKSKATAYLVGGYKKFRQLAGRDTSVVNLTFTGRMMNSVRGFPVISGDTYRVEVRATGGNQDKAYWTDRQREWLVLFPDELETLSKEGERFMVEQIEKLGDTSVRY